jgi:hypothetical protein
MPVLDPTVISNWYRIKDEYNNFYVVQDFSMNQNSSVQNKPLVQGDIGTRIMDVGGISYTWSVNSPALVTDGTVVGNVLTLIKNGWYNIKTGGVGAAYLLERGAIRINKEGVDCNASFKSDNPSSFVAEYGTNGSNYIARVAKWYDSYFTFTFRGIQSANLSIENAEINFDPEIGERYFVGGTQAPYFSVNSYKLSGTITFLVPPAEFYKFRSIYQTGNDSPGNLAGTRSFYVTGIENANLVIGLPGTGGFNLQLGTASMTTEITAAIKAGDITKVTLKFVSYANSSTNESS